MGHCSLGHHLDQWTGSLHDGKLGQSTCAQPGIDQTSHETDMLQPTHDRHQLFAPCTVRVHPLLCTRSLRPKTSGRTWRTTGKLFARWISSNSLSSHAWQTYSALSSPSSHAPASPARLSSTYFSLYRTRRTAPAHDSFCSPTSCTTPATRKSGPCGSPLSREGTPRFGYK